MSWYEFAAYGLSVLAIFILPAAVFGRLSEHFKPHRELIKQVSFAALVLSAFVWYINIPSAGYISEREPLPEINTIGSDADLRKHLEVQRERINVLERDLYEEKKLSERFTRYYTEMLLLGLMALMNFGTYFLFVKKDQGPQEPPDDMIKLDLER